MRAVAQALLTAHRHAKGERGSCFRVDRVRGCLAPDGMNGGMARIQTPAAAAPESDHAFLSLSRAREADSVAADVEVEHLQKQVSRVNWPSIRY